MFSSLWPSWSWFVAVMKMGLVLFPEITSNLTNELTNPQTRPITTPTGGGNEQQRTVHTETCKSSSVVKTGALVLTRI